MKFCLPLSFASAVRFGFPPRPLSEKEASPLNQVSNGESLLVVLKTAGGPSALARRRWRLESLETQSAFCCAAFLSGIARAFTELCQNSPSKRASSSSQKTDLNSRPPGLNVVTLHSPRSVRRRQGTRADSAGEAEGASEKRRRRALRLGSSEEEVAENLVRLFVSPQKREALAQGLVSPLCKGLQGFVSPRYKGPQGLVSPRYKGLQGLFFPPHRSLQGRVRAKGLGSVGVSSLRQTSALPRRRRQSAMPFQTR